MDGGKLEAFAPPEKIGTLLPETHPIKKALPSATRIALSLGKKETKTPNRMMRHVLDDTRAMEELFIERDVPTTLELNPGNHFAQTDLRMARGIHWILTH